MVSTFSGRNSGCLKQSNLILFIYPYLEHKLWFQWHRFTTCAMPKCDHYWCHAVSSGGDRRRKKHESNKMLVQLLLFVIPSIFHDPREKFFASVGISFSIFDRWNWSNLTEWIRWVTKIRWNEISLTQYLIYIIWDNKRHQDKFNAIFITR